MRMLHITKQSSRNNGLKRKPAPFSLAVAAGHRRELRSDGVRSPEVAFPVLQKLLRKQGAAELNASLPLLPQAGLAGRHWQLVHLRIANIRIELLDGEAIDTWKVVARKHIAAVTQACHRC